MTAARVDGRGDATTEDRLLTRLKRRGAQTAAQLAEHLQISAVGARQHLAALAERRLVDALDRRQGVGRPKRYWQLSDAGHARFPDRHAQLTGELLNAARAAFGDAGLDALIAQRETASRTRYRRVLARVRRLERRVAKLAGLRSREGYMADWRRADDDSGALLLLENHCPVCAAARRCKQLCRSELRLFQTLLGDQAEVERIEHLLAGARRCVYKITPRRP